MTAVSLVLKRLFPSKRWPLTSLRSTELVGWAASAGLMLVLLFLTLFAIGVAAITHMVADETQRAAFLSKQYQLARYALSTEESFERKYRLEPGTQVRAAHSAAANDLVAALTLVREHGTAVDQQLVDTVLDEHRQYLLATARLFAAVDLGDAASIIAIDSSETDPIFTQIEQQINGAASAQEQLALASIATLNMTQHLVFIATPVVFVIGLAMLALCWYVLRGYQSRIDAAAQQAAQLELERVKQTAAAEQSALHHREERFAALLRNTADIIAIVDQVGMIRYVSPSGERILGYKPAQLIGKQWLDFVYPDDIATASSTMAAIVAHPGTLLTSETRFQHADSSWRSFEVISSNLLDDPNVGGILINGRDVTERKRMEEARQARDEAQRANTAKNEFLSRMSHELRTPLNAILGFAQLMELEKGEGDQQESISMILTAGRHLLRLIEEVLDISRIEQGHADLHLERVALHEVLRDERKLIGPLVAECGLTLEVAVAAESSGVVLADERALRQVLLNLLSNAVKYNRTGGSIHLVSTLNSPSMLRVMVRDDGIGIAVAQLPRLFTPFDRLGAENTEIEGTGLGLALSQRLMEAMGSKIQVSSTVGGGSEFWFDLPLADPTPVALYSGQSLLPPTS